MCPKLPRTSGHPRMNSTNLNEISNSTLKMLVTMQCSGFEEQEAIRVICEVEVCL
ncbi:predicted protein [Botrytis cinerea T4]|uniref:Uncharacterized protein n=1 Tax=Botryotinia fuckeliana (strain T4) TaxID=999810 RepID=G2YSQ5_BOTF4|nr:predicted protein [Botrytis cinerea T4]